MCRYKSYGLVYHIKDIVEGLYPVLMGKMDDPGCHRKDPVRLDAMQYLGLCDRESVVISVSTFHIAVETRTHR